MIKIRLVYCKLGFLKFISHLDTAELLRRAISYSGADIAYSGGYNPHMVLSFANPLPLGVSSDFELFDMTLNSLDDLDGLVKKMNEYLPDQIQIKDYYLLGDNESINSEFSHSKYEFEIISDIDLEDIDLDLKTDLYQNRMKKKGKKKIPIREDISPYVKSYEGFTSEDDNVYRLTSVLETSLEKTINPNRFIQAIFDKYEILIDIDEVFIHKSQMYKY